MSWSGWQPGNPLPASIGDAFVVMYDWFEHHHRRSAFNATPFLFVRDEASTRDLTGLIQQHAGATPDKLGELISASSTSESQARAVFSSLHAIDIAIGEWPPPLGSDRMKLLLNQWFTTGRFNPTTSGYLLPNRARLFRGTHFPDLFRFLIRADVSRDHVHLIRPGSSVNGSIPALPMRIAVVPFLYTYADATFNGYQRQLGQLGDYWFEIQHANPRLPLENRLRNAVAELRSSGATIAIFPELTLSSDLLTVLQDELRITDAPGTSLEWVIAGAYAERTDTDDIFAAGNSAYVLDSGGGIVGAGPPGTGTGWVQPKHHRYKLTVGEQDRYGIEVPFVHRQDHEEGISTGSELFVFDANDGRYAILICEDWGQSAGPCAALRNLGCSLIFVLVMDGPLSPTKWEAKKAGPFVEQTGANVIVANSMLLTNSQGTLNWFKKQGIVIDDSSTHDVLMHFQPVERDPRGIGPGSPRPQRNRSARMTPDTGETQLLSVLLDYPES